MRVPIWPTRFPTTTLVEIPVKYHGYFDYRETSKRRKISTRQRNWNGVRRWHRPGVAFCKTWSPAVSSTKLQERCLIRLRMVCPLLGVQYSEMGHPFNAFIDAESSSARRARTQPYFAPDGNRTTFHHYVPTNGGKIKPSQPVPLTGLIFSTTYCRLSDCIP